MSYPPEKKYFCTKIDIFVKSSDTTYLEYFLQTQGRPESFARPYPCNTVIICMLDPLPM